jgi:hypothetical protein
MMFYHSHWGFGPAKGRNKGVTEAVELVWRNINVRRFDQLHMESRSRWPLNCSTRCGHLLLTTEKIRVLVDNIGARKIASSMEKS